MWGFVWGLYERADIIRYFPPLHIAGDGAARAGGAARAEGGLPADAEVQEGVSWMHL